MKTTIPFLFLILITTNLFSQKKQSEKINYGKNIISFMPLSAVTNNHVGVGLSYEYLASEYIGVRIPIMAGINLPYFNGCIELKLYPAKNTGPAKYAIAPTIMFGHGEVDRFNNWGQSGHATRTHFGFLLNNTVNFTIAKNFFIGIDGGIGINYFDKLTPATSNVSPTNSTSFLAQFQIMMGGRF